MPPPGDLAAAVVRRERQAIARAVSLVEDRRGTSEGGIIRLLATLRTLAPVPAQRIGITGPPGVGKSTLVSAFARALRDAKRSVAVLAVDPSSPRSGGALLGDRARIELDPDDDGIFVRSMASGGDLGGLARAAGAALDVLASSFDVVLVETTGVGQSETDVEHVVDTVCFVAQPASGDVLQFLKAGILEIPDVLVVNKMDLGDVAQRAVADLASALAVAAAVGVGEGGAPSPVLGTSAATGAGIDALVTAVDRHFASLSSLGPDALVQRRARGAAHWALRWLERRHGEAAVESLGGRSIVHARIQREVAQGKLPLSVSRELGEEYLGGLRRR